MLSRTLTLALASVCVIGARASMPVLPLSQAAKQIQSVQQPTKKAVSQELQGKLTELGSLKDRAAGVTKKIGELATEGKLPTSEAGVQVLQDLVDQLKQTNEALRKVQEDVEGILGWIEGQNENLPVMSTDIAQLKRVTQSNYVQFQYVHTDPDASQSTRTNGFQMRRFRMSQTNKIDDKTSMKLSFDVATSSARLAAELKDAILFYDIVPSIEQVGTQLAFGQQALPLGYELERSSSEREFPERAIYNTTLFSGERDRGFVLKQGVGKSAFVHVGAWSGQTVNDPQQLAVGFRDIDNKLAVTAGARLYGTNYDVGVSAIAGQRPSFTGNSVTASKANRRVVYIDGNIVGLVEGLSLRGEWMFGKDRVPTLTNAGAPIYLQENEVSGGQIQLSYNLGKWNQVHVRYQTFEPGQKSPSDTGDNTVSGWGYGFTHWLGAGAKVTLSYEAFRERPSVRNNVLTLRTQFKL